MDETCGGDPLLHAAHINFIFLVRRGHSGLYLDNLQEQGLHNSSESFLQCLTTLMVNVFASTQTEFLLLQTGV